jgi:Cu-Zn family superoxide dismutase
MRHATAIFASAVLLAGASAWVLADEMRPGKLPPKSPPSKERGATVTTTAPTTTAAPKQPGAAPTAAPAPPAPAPTKPAAPALAAKAEIKAVDGKDVGTVVLTQTPAGVRLELALKGLPSGERAFHVHAVGKCESPFASAGPHFNPGAKKHGHLNPDGQHAGDMPNLQIPLSGSLTLVVVNKEITLEKGKPNSVFHAGGTAIVIHADKDDYKSDPAGNAGARIACGVITESGGATAGASPRK